MFSNPENQIQQKVTEVQQQDYRNNIMALPWLVCSDKISNYQLLCNNHFQDYYHPVKCYIYQSAKNSFCDHIQSPTNTQAIGRREALSFFFEYSDLEAAYVVK